VSDDNELDEIDFDNLDFEDEKFKFDVIIGNPPYQEELKDTSDRPIYHLFMDAAYKIAKRVAFITPARFLFNAGKTPKAWNKKMLEDEHLKVIYYEQEASRVFPNNPFEGGVAITYRDADAKFGAIGLYTVYPELNRITQKVKLLNEKSINNIMYLQNKFNLNELYSDYPEFENIVGSNGREKRLTTSIFELLDILFTKEKRSETDLLILGLANSKRTKKFISRNYIENSENLEKYKVLISKSNGASGTLSREPARIISLPELSEPLMGFTQSFISIGAFNSHAEAEAVLKYVKSKFTRILLGVLKVTQDNSPDKWEYVPLQDFTPSSDIDWTKSIREIDQQLYAKYNLDDIEIAFIESHIEEMA